MSGAGGQYSSIGSFDPTKMTVGEFVRQYVDKAKGKTGEALSDVVHEVELGQYKSEKAHLEAEKSALEVDINELAKIIEDIEAL